MSLTDTACRTARGREAPYKLSDGGGLHLLVTSSGSRLWRMAYRFGGKQKTLAFGPYPAVPLAAARKRRDEAKELLAAGLDPGEAKKQARAEAASRVTFGALADEYFAKHGREGHRPHTSRKLEWMLRVAKEDLGERLVTDIRAPEVLDTLRKFEARGRHQSARRLKSSISRVFRYAIASGRAETDPTIALADALTVPAVKPRAAVTAPKALAGLLRSIDGYDGQPTTHAALRLLPILFPRPGELRAAEWAEYDLEAEQPTWTIPGERMKMRRPHRSPLPRQAAAILADLHRVTGRGRLLFPSIRTVLRPISDNTLNAALRRLGYAQDEATAHGFRATASTLLNESGLWNPDAIERQLAHVEANDVRRAYARGEHWDERVRMMQWWADYLDDLREKGNEEGGGRANDTASLR